jgi:hypothetical protein
LTATSISSLVEFIIPSTGIVTIPKMRIIFIVTIIVWFTTCPISVGRSASCDPTILHGTFPSSIWWYVSIANPTILSSILRPHPIIFSRIIDTKHRCTRIRSGTISIALIPSTNYTTRVESWIEQITTSSI